MGAMVCLAATSCRDTGTVEWPTDTPDISGEPGAPTFFGDSTLTIISANRPNGYLVKFFQTKDMVLLNLSRGDSINRYIALDEFPMSLTFSSCQDLSYRNDLRACGTYIRELDIPVQKELTMGLFFMDVNFDGDEELVVSYEGYNQLYFACYDLVHARND